MKKEQTSSLAPPKKLIFAKMKLSSYARRFIANGVSHKLQPLKIYANINLSRRLAFMVADFGILFGYGAKLTAPQSASLTAPEVALQPVAQEDASGVDTVNSRVNCFAISLAALPPPIHQGENVNFELRTRQRATFLPNFPQRKCQPQFTHTPRASSSQK